MLPPLLDQPLALVPSLLILCHMATPRGSPVTSPVAASVTSQLPESNWVLKSLTEQVLL